MTRRTLTGGQETGGAEPYDLAQFGGGDLADVDQAEGAIALLMKQLRQG